MLLQAFSFLGKMEQVRCEMSKKDKNIAIQLTDSQVDINNTKVAGFSLMVGKKLIGEIVELDEKFAVVKNGDVESFSKTLEQAVESIIETYNLNH